MSPTRPSDLISSLGDASEPEVSIVSISLPDIPSGTEDPEPSVSVKNLTRGIPPPVDKVGFSKLETSETDDGWFSTRGCLLAIWPFGSVISRCRSSGTMLVSLLSVSQGIYHSLVENSVITEASRTFCGDPAGE